MKVVEHEKRFKLARKGHGDPLGKYPEFIGKESLSTMDVPKAKKIQNSDQPRWKPGNHVGSKPSPSISLNSRNLIMKRR